SNSAEKLWKPNVDSTTWVLNDPSAPVVNGPSSSPCPVWSSEKCRILTLTPTAGPASAVTLPLNVMVVPGTPEVLSMDSVVWVGGHGLNSAWNVLDEAHVSSMTAVAAPVSPTVPSVASAADP